MRLFSYALHYWCLAMDACNRAPAAAAAAAGCMTAVGLLGGTWSVGLSSWLMEYPVEVGGDGGDCCCW